MKSVLLIFVSIQVGLASMAASASLTTSMIDEATESLKVQVAALPYMTALPGLQVAAGPENDQTIKALNAQFKALKDAGKADITFAEVAMAYKASNPATADIFGLCILSIGWENEKADHQFACEVRLGHVLDVVKDRKVAEAAPATAEPEPFKSEIVRRTASAQ